MSPRNEHRTGVELSGARLAALLRGGVPPVPRVGPQVHGRIMAAIAAGRARPAARPWAPWLRWSAVAAAALVVIGVLVAPPRRQPRPAAVAVAMPPLGLDAADRTAHRAEEAVGDQWQRLAGDARAAGDLLWRSVAPALAVDNAPTPASPVEP